MKILELFCGSGSFSTMCRSREHTTTTLDIDSKFSPDINKDILSVSIKDFEKYDIVWASPPCTEYSKAKSQGKRNLDYADILVIKTLDLIKKLNPKYWIIENPQTGLLKSRPFMKDIPFTDVSYCKYGFPYRKQTRLWNNFEFQGKICNYDCDFLACGLKRKRHISSAGCGGQGQGHKISYSNKSFKKIEKYKIPNKLCEDIIIFIENKENE